MFTYCLVEFSHEVIEEVKYIFKYVYEGIATEFIYDIEFQYSMFPTENAKRIIYRSFTR